MKWNKNLVTSLRTAHDPSLETNSFIDSELNIMCLLGAFVIGIGAEDINKFMTMIGIDGGGTFERFFYLNTSTVCSRILRKCRAIVRSSMLDEIAITIREQNANEISEELLS